MLRSVQRLERRGGFRPRLFDTRRDYLQYQAIARIQGVEREPEPHDRWEAVLRRAAHRPEQVPE